MKLLKIIFITIIIFSVPLGAQIGCMKKSLDLCSPHGCDFKELHYVFCTCPCERYPLIVEKNRCSKCRHFRMIDALTLKTVPIKSASA